MAFKPNVRVPGTPLDPNARVPVRPLEKDAYKQGYKRELLADYTPERCSLWLLDNDGNLINVTASAEMVIDDTIDRLLVHPTILSNIQVPMPEGNTVVLEEAINQCLTEHKEQNEEFTTIKNNLIDNVNTTTTNLSKTVNSQVSQVNSRMDKLEDTVNDIIGSGDIDYDSIAELNAYIKAHGTDVAGMVKNISTNANAIAANKTNISTNATNISKNATAISNLQTALGDYVKRNQIIISTKTFDAYGTKPSDAFLYIQVES